ncbi:unnamed protein product [Cunninghamella blakesleeana]
MKFESVLVLTAFFFLSKQIHAAPTVGEHKNTVAGMQSGLGDKVAPIGAGLGSQFSNLIVGTAYSAAEGMGDGAVSGAGASKDEEQEKKKKRKSDDKNSLKKRNNDKGNNNKLRSI